MKAFFLILSTLFCLSSVSLAKDSVEQCKALAQARHDDSMDYLEKNGGVYGRKMLLLNWTDAKLQDDFEECTQSQKQERYCYCRIDTRCSERECVALGIQTDVEDGN